MALGTGDGTDTVQVQSFLLPYEGVAEKSNTNSQLYLTMIQRQDGDDSSDSDRSEAKTVDQTS